MKLRRLSVLGCAALLSCGGSGGGNDDESFRTTFGYFLTTGDTSVTGVVMRIAGESDITLMENQTGTTQNDNLGFISGQVVSGAGAPLAGVAIQAHNDSGLPAGSVIYQSAVNGAYSTALTVTGATGRFIVMNVQPGRVDLKCGAGADGNLYVQMPAAAAAFVQLTATATGTQPEWSGLTVNLIASGRTLPGSAENAVNYQLLGSGASPGPLSHVTTGAFDLGQVPARNEFLVKCTKTGFVDTYTYVRTVNADLTAGLGGGNVFITSPANRDNELNASGVTLAPGTGIVTGRVLSGTGGFVVEARDGVDQPVGVIRYGDNGDGGRPDATMTSTDVDGIFYIYNVPPGQIFLRATGGTQAVSTYVEAFADGITITVDQVPMVQSQATITISGGLGSLQGFAVPEASIVLHGLGLADQSDVFGEYALTGVPTRHLFIVRTFR